MKEIIISDRSILDTALLFPHPRGPPAKSALRVLARRFLDRDIQSGAHDSAIDARTALDLVRLKVKHGPSFGLQQERAGAGAPRAKLVDVLCQQHKLRCCLVDRPEVLARHATGSAAAVPVHSDEAAVAKAGKAMVSGTYDFVWTQLTRLGQWLGDRSVERKRLDTAWLAPGALGPSLPPALDPASHPTPHHPLGQSHSQEGQRPEGQPVPVDSFLLPPAHSGATPPATTTDNADWPANQQAAVTTPPSCPAPGDGEDQTEEGGRLEGEGLGAGGAYGGASLEATLRHVDRAVGELWSALPSNSLLLVATGQGDTGEVERLREQRAKRMAVEGCAAWRNAQQAAFEALEAMAMQGLLFAAVKP
ncbi:hypothetical protein QJQ45_020371 [Haematococcus lacustris]|nr:hypothetical protein QJQ45_020371 [Haematococcus lacustris]